MGRSEDREARKAAAVLVQAGGGGTAWWWCRILCLPTASHPAPQPAPALG